MVRDRSSYSYRRAEAMIVAGVILGIAFPVVIILMYLLNGWVLSILWGWFITPVFPAAPEISIVEAMGISLIVGFLTSHYSENQEHKAAELISLVVKPLVALGIGWVIYQFV